MVTKRKTSSKSKKSTKKTLLEVQNLSTHFSTRAGLIKAVNDVSFTLDAGEVLAIVGESGCGKSVSALSIMGLIPNPPGKIVNGKILFEGNDLVKAPPGKLQGIRGEQISMIFQEPMTSLNPVMTIGSQISESLILHKNLSKKEAWNRAGELLLQVGIPDALEKMNDYPHQMSGGQRQRVMIAIAMSCDPKLLIADEATTALDVTVQAQILELLMKVTQESKTALIIITHNLGIVARYADRVNVMYAGKIIETGTAMDVYKKPGHPYTQGLLGSVPNLLNTGSKRLTTIEGEIPDLSNLPKGCSFAPRCPSPTKEGKKGNIEMKLIEVSKGHWVDQCGMKCGQNN
ncbi:MAG: peptide ABC transporter ATP-binding protein [Dehalococcoidia bacterium]|mgnify:CR=1 FL=1|nr:peptide ABC transporter ATP-binding protein [Dehalococcoidia bacterium]MQG08810.1 ABC transporter ATP-binding protein [SAR202 cluster bacterium]|tara:strand:- start:1418 stop:2452 length:1035 start_codon:yes stop_codon:yes gene_type:complete